MKAARSDSAAARPSILRGLELVAITAICLALQSGCALTREAYLAVPIERRSSGAVEITGAEVSVYRDGRILLHGHVSKQFGYSSPYQSHLDVTVYDGQGRILEEVVAHYQPFPIPRDRRGRRGRSSFTVRLKQVPADGRIVIRHHQAELSEPNPPAVQRPSPLQSDGLACPLPQPVHAVALR